MLKYTLTLILAGSKDPISNTECNLAFIEKMKKYKRQARFIEYIGQGHTLFKRHPSNPHFRATINYMERFLKRVWISGGNLINA